MSDSGPEFFRLQSLEERGDATPGGLCHQYARFQTSNCLPLIRSFTKRFLPNLLDESSKSSTKMLLISCMTVNKECNLLNQAKNSVYLGVIVSIE